MLARNHFSQQNTVLLLPPGSLPKERKTFILDFKGSCISHTQTMADIWMMGSWSILGNCSQEARLRGRNKIYFLTCKISEKTSRYVTLLTLGVGYFCDSKCGCLVYFRMLSTKSLTFHLTMFSHLCRLKVPPNSWQITDGRQSWLWWRTTDLDVCC